MRSIEEHYTLKSTTSYTTSKGVTVSVGDMVVNWSDNIGYVTSIGRIYGRWRIKVRFFDSVNEYQPEYFASKFGTADLRHHTINEGQ